MTETKKQIIQSVHRNYEQGKRIKECARLKREQEANFEPENGLKKQLARYKKNMEKR